MVEALNSEPLVLSIQYIKPGKPQQNAFIERFNWTYREELLNAYVFETLTQVRLITEHWLEIYNAERPHRALGHVPPWHFAARQQRLDLSRNGLST